MLTHGHVRQIQITKPQSIISLLIKLFIILTQSIGNVSPISRGFRNNHFPVAKMVQKTHPKIPNDSSPQDQDLGISCYRTSILQSFSECELWHNQRVRQVESFLKSCTVLKKTCLHLFAKTSCGQVPGKISKFMKYRWRNSKLVATHA